MDGQIEGIHISFCLESVNSAAGVTSAQNCGGFTSEEALEIALCAGAHPLVKAFDLSEYNPHVED